MGWFSKKKSLKLELEKWDVQDKDFITDSLYDYDSPYLKSILLDVREMIPGKYYDQVFVGGGFASHLAGITNEHNDVDIFCVTESAFEAVSKLIINDKDPDRFQQATLGSNTTPLAVMERGYGRILKFASNGVKYDLVDATLQINIEPDRTPSILNLLRAFDLNWSMVAIDLAGNTITCHRESLSDKPRINPARLDVILNGIVDRVARYRDRLTKTPDKDECAAVLIILNRMLKEQKERGIVDTEVGPMDLSQPPAQPGSWY